MKLFYTILSFFCKCIKNEDIHQQPSRQPSPIVIKRAKTVPPRPNKTTTAIDIYGRKIVKSTSFFYLGYPFIDFDVEDN